MRRTSLALALVLAALAAPAAQAAPTADLQFDVVDQPNRVTTGPDGNIWVTLGGPTHNLAKIAPDSTGAVTFYDDPAVAGLTGIVAGPDGNLWATKVNNVVKIDPNNPAGAQSTTINPIGSPNGIIVGPDGQLWTASDDAVIRINPNNTADNQEVILPGASQAKETAAGTDGRVWVAGGNGSGTVYSVSTDGTTVTPHPAGDAASGPQGVAGGSNGQVAFSNPVNSPEIIGRLVNGGQAQIQEQAGDPFGMVFGLDGAYWIAMFADNTAGRFTTDGAFTEPVGPFGPTNDARYIANGPGGTTLFVTLELGHKVARISGIEPPPPPPPPPGGATPPAKDSIRPVLGSLSMSSTAFLVGRAATPVNIAATGTRIRFNLSEPSRVRIRIEQKLPGRRSGRRCVAPRRRNLRNRRCNRFVRKGTLTRTGVQGVNTVPFSGRIGRKALKPGNYRLFVEATDLAGNVTQRPSTKSFRILAPKRKRR